ncbi:MAG: hypothetical protein ABJO36_12100 [Litorimonas sp.]
MDLTTVNIVFWLYGLATLATILIGLLYATRRQVMPYHLKALETSWDDIDPKYQFLLKALLNGGGYYGLSVGLFMLVLLVIPFRNGEDWAGYAIGLIGLVGTFPLGYIVYRVKKHTAGNPPLGVMIVINLLLIAGLIATVLG